MLWYQIMTYAIGPSSMTMCSVLTLYHIPELLNVSIEKRSNKQNNDNQDENAIFFAKCLDLILDPELLSLKILQSLIVKGFRIECDFFLYYHHRQCMKLLVIENDQDLLEAIRVSSLPYLHLIIDLIDYGQLLKMSLHQQQWEKPQGSDQKTMKSVADKNVDSNSMGKLLKYKVLSEWDIVTSSDIILAQTLMKTNNFIFNQIEKLKNKARCLELSSKSSMLSMNSWLFAEAIYQYIMNDDAKQQPISDIWPFLDSLGRVQSQRDFRIAVYRGGMDATLRRIGWKHLLNIYPEDFTGQERIDFIRVRSETYRQMRDLWQRNRLSDPEVINVCDMVRKDVRRTDRHHSFYKSCADETEDADLIDQQANNLASDVGPTTSSVNGNVISLFNILVTYALNHKHRYCQGMSDLVSPLLYVMKDESHAYIAFCALMQRLGENFANDGNAINRKFRNLRLLLKHYDPKFYKYLRQEHAEELLFTYRWILLDLKREFPFDDVLEMLEVLWASIPPSNNSSAINLMNLFDAEYLYTPNHSSESNVKSSTVSPVHTKPCSKLEGIKFSSNFQKTTTTLESPIVDNNEVIRADWKDKSELRPKPWDSPSLLNENHLKFQFPKSISAAQYVDVGSSRFYVDTYDLSASSGSSYDGDGEDEFDISSFSRKLHQEQQVGKVINDDKRINGDEISSCSTFDSGIDRSNLIITYPENSSQEDAEKNLIENKNWHKNPQTSINRLNFIVHCNGDDCTQQEYDEFERFDALMDHGYLTDRRKKQTEDTMSPPTFMRMRSQSASVKSHHWNPPKAKKLLELSDLTVTKKASTVSVSACQTNVKQVSDTIINQQFNNLSAKSVSEEMLNSAIKQMETLKVDEQERTNRSASSSSSIELLPGPEDWILSTTIDNLDDEENMENMLSISPERLGSNDAFMLFVCLTLLLQNSEYIMQQKMDRNDIQIYFDEMVRKHDVKTVLKDARHLFHTYLAEWRSKDRSK